MKHHAHIHRRLIAHLLAKSGKRSPQEFDGMGRAEFLNIHANVGVRCWKLVQYILGKRKTPY